MGLWLHHIAVNSAKLSDAFHDWMLYRLATTFSALILYKILVFFLISHWLSCIFASVAILSKVLSYHLHVKIWFTELSQPRIHYYKAILCGSRLARIITYKLNIEWEYTTIIRNQIKWILILIGCIWWYRIISFNHHFRYCWPASSCWSVRMQNRLLQSILLSIVPYIYHSVLYFINWLRLLFWLGINRGMVELRSVIENRNSFLIERMHLQSVLPGHLVNLYIAMPVTYSPHPTWTDGQLELVLTIFVVPAGAVDCRSPLHKISTLTHA